MFELRKLGLNIYLFGIRPEISNELLEEDKKLIEDTVYLYPLKLLRIINSNLYFVIRNPFKYFKTLFSVIFNEEKNIFQHFKLIYHFFVSSNTAKEMKKQNIEHIHAHFMNVPATIALYCSNLLGITFSVTHHSAGIGNLNEMIGLKQKIKESKFICSISNHNRDYLDKVYSSKNKNFVVRCGIDPSEYTSKINHKNLREKNILSILAVGRFVEKKGFKYLIEALNLLKKEHINLNIIGDGPLKKELIFLSKKYKLNNIIFKGYLSQKEIKKELDKTDIFIVPSVTSSTGEKEGLPVVIMEAMALGVPVIATKHSGIPEIVKDKETGLLVPEKDPESIKRAIKLLAKNIKLRAEIIENGNKMIMQEFNIKNIAKIKKKIFEKNLK
ncbi:MAG: glycosyltransferase family 4 protein [Fusobacteriaceae bacterium]|nr:glycosyltransferase family 4 protein [Fusobacteriaceae bacterium]